MKIAINLLQLTPGRPEGVVTYVRELLSNIGDFTENDRIYVLVQQGLELPSLNEKSIEIVPFGRKKEEGLKPSLYFDRLKRKLSLSKNNPSLSELIEKRGIQLIHYPFSIIPELDQKLSIPIILSVMDLQHEYFPDLFTSEDLLARQKNFYTSTQRADHIIAISEYTKESLVKKLTISESKIEVIYLAGNLSKTPDTSIVLPKNFMYYPAGDWPHKNHQNLFRAMAYLRKKERFVPQLILSGLQNESKLMHQKFVDELGISDEVTHLGQVSYDQVAGIYKRATMLIYPSLFEGFGIPLLEAMTANIPIACSNRSSIPEVTASAACYFNPENPESIARAIEKVWHNKSYRDVLIARGKIQVNNFSWRACASDTYNSYKRVLKVNRG